MTTSRFVRGTKTRMFAFACLLFVLAAVVYVIHGSQSSLFEVQKDLLRCNQQKEYAHAQFQVIFGIKTKIEESVSEQKKAIENLKSEKENLERELQEVQNKNNALKQSNNLMQVQIDDLKDGKEKSDKIAGECSTVQDENNRLQVALEKTKEENKKLNFDKVDSLENLKAEFLKKDKEVSDLKRDLENCKAKSLPEADKNKYYEKQNFQLRTELDLLKETLSACTSKLKPTPTEEKKKDDEDLGKLALMKNFSSTPNINPEALLGLSSAKPSVKESEVGKKQDVLPPKKPTQESIGPLVQPGNEDFVDHGPRQIPMPPNPVNPQGNILKKPDVEDNEMSNNVIEDLEPEDPSIGRQQVRAQLVEPNLLPDKNRAEEEDDHAPGVNFKHIDSRVGKNQDNYHGGDYDKEQVQEEDEEGEQIDYDGDRALKKLEAPIKTVQSD